MNRFIALAAAVMTLALISAIFGATPGTAQEAEPEPVFTFQRFEFIGDLVLPMEPLKEAFQPLAGASLSMEDLQSLTAVVESYYAQGGYPFVLAYFPQQTIEEGVVAMAVVVGRYGRLVADNRSRLRQAVVDKLFRRFVPDDGIYAPALDGQVAKLRGLPGVEADVLYAAGEHFGQTDVTLEIDDGERWRVGVTAATAGPVLFRQTKWAADAAFFNAFGLGDRTELTFTTDGVSSSRAAVTYEMPVGRELDYDLRIDVSSSQYQLAGSWAGLGSGWSRGSGVGVGRDWTAVSGSRWQANGTLRYDGAQDEFLGTVTSHEVTSWRGSVEWTPGTTPGTGKAAAGTSRTTDSEGAGPSEAGATVSPWRPQRWALHIVAGQLALGTPTQRALDASTAKAEGVFGLIRFDADWGAPFGRGAVAVKLTGQTAFKNLTSSEKFSLAEAVRSGLEGRGAGDEGWSVQAEYSVGPGTVAFIPGAMRLTAFVDAGGITYNKHPWDATGQGGRTAGAVGFRLDWQPVGELSVRMQQGWTFFDSIAVVSPGQAGPLSFSMTYSF